MSEEKTEVTDAQVHMLMKIAKHPGAPFGLLLLAGPVIGYLMTTYVVPEIRESIEAHKVDVGAHPDQFGRLAAIENRMGELEKQYETDTTALATMLGKVADKLEED